MALIKCPDCGKLFSEYAERCPDCGCPMEDVKAANKKNSSSISQDIEVNESDELPSYNCIDESVSQESVQSSMGGDEDIVEEKNTIRKWLWCVGILAVIVIGFIIAYQSFGSQKNNKGNTTEIGLIQEQVEQEQKIIERAEYIFKNLPNHKSIEVVDNTVFTPSFLTVLEKANGYWEMLAASDEEDLTFESVFYWYQGNEIDPDGKLVGLSLSKIENDTAYIKVIYKNYEPKEHTMKLILVNGQWLCDNWDKMKENLLTNIKQIESSNIVSSIGTQERMEEIKSHEWGNKMLHHHLVGTMSDETGKHPIELDFDYCNVESGTIENVIYTNVELGGKIKMDGEVSRGGLLIFSGKDGNLSFTIRIDPSDFEGESFVGDKHLTVSLMPQCNHSSVQQQ
ncbi:MAG: hypothetical protein IJS63_09120 [Bacteroidaceae bacterium]|nr:hypothetical protein [Bacteroidaceae bacterium]